MAEQPAEEKPSDIKSFTKSFSPTGSRPSSFEFDESGSTENLPNHSTLPSGATPDSDEEKLRSETGSSEGPVPNNTPEAVPKAVTSRPQDCSENTSVGTSSVVGGGLPANHTAMALQNSDDSSNNSQQDLTGSSDSNNRKQGLIGSCGSTNQQPVADTSCPGEKCIAKKGMWCMPC